MPIVVKTPYKYCPVCGQSAALNAPQCGGCGHIYQTQFDPNQTIPIQQTQIVPPHIPPTQAFIPQYPSKPINGIQVPAGTHSAIAALVLSIVIPGGGAFYNKQFEKAILLLFALPILIFMPLFLAPLFRGLSLSLWMFLAFYPFLHIAQIVDASMIASALNRGEVVRRWDCFR